MPSVIEDLRPMEPSTAQHIFENTKRLAPRLENLPHEPLTSSLPGLSPLALADWRILYSIDGEEQIVAIHKIRTRKVLEGKQTGQ